MTKQSEIISEMGVAGQIDPAEEIDNRVSFLADYLGKTGLKGFVLGISGGQDSLLAGALAQKAVEKVRASGGKAEFHAVLLPYGEQADANDARLACEFIQPDKLHDFNIKAATDAFALTFKDGEGHAMADFEKGNVKARMRMIAQYTIAAENGLLVVGTDHAAEAVTGFFTKFGDGGADIVPLAGLNKRQGKQLLRHLGAPEQIIGKAPTADLLDGKPGQTDEAELGLTYNQIDDYLEGKPVESPVAAKLEERYNATKHKRALPAAFGSRH